MAGDGWALGGGLVSRGVADRQRLRDVCARDLGPLPEVWGSGVVAGGRYYIEGAALFNTTSGHRNAPPCHRMILIAQNSPSRRVLTPGGPRGIEGRQGAVRNLTGRLNLGPPRPTGRRRIFERSSCLLVYFVAVGASNFKTSERR